MPRELRPPPTGHGISLRIGDIRKTTIILLACVLTTTACADLNGIGPKQGIGTLGGAAAGGLAGAQVGKGKGQLAMTALGALLGAFAGGSIGSSLDKADQLAMERSTYAALDAQRIGKPVAWSNPRTGNRGTVVTTNQTVSAEGYCREYQQTVTIGGRSEKAFGVACRQPDGTWKIG